MSKIRQCDSWLTYKLFAAIGSHITVGRQSDIEHVFLQIMSLVKDFYRNKTVFITGATGYVGKVSVLTKCLES